MAMPEDTRGEENMDVKERNVLQEGEGRIALDLDDLITTLGGGGGRSGLLF